MSYVLLKENLAFKKYPAIYELELNYGVNLGHAYRTKDSAKQFAHCIAECQRHIFISSLSKAHFYSFLMDGSTDS